MIITTEYLGKMAQLACLDIDTHRLPQLMKEIQAIMNFINTLSSIDTHEVEPLFHPFALHQPLRTDEVCENNCLPELKNLAPKFENFLYLVPQVIDPDA